MAEVSREEMLTPEWIRKEVMRRIQLEKTMSASPEYVARRKSGLRNKFKSVDVKKGMLKNKGINGWYSFGDGKMTFDKKLETDDFTYEQVLELILHESGHIDSNGLWDDKKGRAISEGRSRMAQKFIT